MAKAPCAAILAALFILCPREGVAQDVTLSSRDGALAVSGLLVSFDGEVYRIDSDYGRLTLDAQGVICEGPACPDLTAPKAVIRITGLPDLGGRLLPGLISAFARTKGWDLRGDFSQGGAILLSDPVKGATLAEFHFAPEASSARMQAVLADAGADLVLTSQPVAGQAIRQIGQDALIVLAAADNPLPRISSLDLAKVLSGEITSWSQIGGPEMPLELHGLVSDHPFALALAARLGREMSPKVSHPDLDSLLAALNKDPYAIAVVPQSTRQGQAREIPLTDSCGFPLSASASALKSGDYPLALTISLALPKRRLPLATREFLDFLGLPAAQKAIAEAGLSDRSVISEPFLAEPQRMMNAVAAAEGAEGLAELQRLAALGNGAQRLSLTFRFEDETQLEAQSQDDLAELARLVAVQGAGAPRLVLVGFSDGQGEEAENKELSLRRAEAIRAALGALLPDLAPGALPLVDGFGEAMPIACDKTAAGRRLNRRVEVWQLAPGAGDKG